MTRRPVAAPLPAPEAGGLAETPIVERASASPGQAPAGRARHARRAVAQAPLAVPLRAAQDWFANVVTHPRSVAAGVAAANPTLGLDARALTRLVTDGPQLDAAGRLAIYHYAYHARLVDCLIDDYPALQYALGHAPFEALAREVIQHRPSRGPNLNFYGRNLITWCGERPARWPLRAFATDLARLEWAMVEVLHAAAAPVLRPEALKAIPMERWGAVRLRPSATVQVLRFAYPVNRFLQDWREERAPAVPAAAPSATAVYRRGFALWRMDLTMPMAAILESLFAGRPLGEALATLEATTAPEQLAEVAGKVMVWFREWVEGGFFAAFDERPAPRRRRAQATSPPRRAAARPR